jgi:hypothetical protein
MYQHKSGFLVRGGVAWESVLLKTRLAGGSTGHCTR